VEEGVLDPSRVIQIGMRGPIYGVEDYDQSRKMGMELIDMEEVRRIGLPSVVARAVERVGTGPTFLSFDIDSLDPAFAPGTGTPEVGGFTTYEALQLVRGLIGVDFVGGDLVEVIPAYDHAEITALAAANVLFELVSVLAANRRDRLVATS